MQTEQLSDGMVASLDFSPEQALFERKIEGIVACIYKNERPLQGLSGILDWRFHGVISSYIRKGVISGEAGECTYVPISKGGRVYHLILVGAGEPDRIRRRGALPTESLAALNRNLKTLKLRQVGVSREDFGGTTEAYFSKKFKGVPLWIVQ